MNARILETRNGSDQTLKQQVWSGNGYVDELVQIGLNQDTNDTTEQLCERFFWVCQDANFNVLGVVAYTADGGKAAQLVERYEYTPYGQRQVYSHGWLLADLDDSGKVDTDDHTYLYSAYLFGTDGGHDSRADLNGDGSVTMGSGSTDETKLNAALGQTLLTNDPLLLLPRSVSFRGIDASGSLNPAPLCEFGHQGLIHDEEVGLVYNRARMLHPRLGRFMQEDPLGYVDGCSKVEYQNSNINKYLDAYGLSISISVPSLYIRHNVGGHQMGFSQSVLEALQRIIGNCARLDWQPVYTTVRIRYGFFGNYRVFQELDHYELRYRNVNPHCTCNDCWTTLKSVIDDTSIDVRVNSWSTTHMATGDPDGGPRRNVFINPNLQVTVPEIDPLGGPDIPTLARFDIVLWHEAIDHSGLGLTHPNEPWNFTGGGGYDPTIRDENHARDCLRRQGIGVRDRIHTYYYH